MWCKQSILVLLLVACAVLQAIAGRAEVDVAAGKRKGFLKWGAKYTIPEVKGATIQVYNEYKKGGFKPLASGIRLSKAFMENRDKIPCVPLHDPGVNNSCLSSIFLNFHNKSPFPVMELDYTTGGHAPAKIYDVAHFDFHFYLVPKSEVVKTLSPVSGAPCPPAFTADTFMKVHKPIPSKCYPKGFSNVGAAAPLMGNHLLDLSGPEFVKPGTFDQTWIYGSFDGKITFFEPMLTPKVLTDSAANACRPIPSVPKKFPKAGWYPTTYCYLLAKNGHSYVELRDYVWKSAGCKKPKTYDGYLTLAPDATLPAECKYEKKP